MNDTIKNILENLPICAYITDLNHNLLAGSTEFVKVINREDYELQDLTLEDIYDKEHLELLKAEEEQVLQTGCSYEVERQVIFPSKSFWGRVKHTPAKDKNGNIEYIIVMYENLDPIKDSEMQKEYFIETLTHDLKIPTLAQLRGLELLKSEFVGGLNQEQQELVSHIEDSCEYILDMISMIVNTYRFETGANKLVYEKFDLVELLFECFAKLSEIAKEKSSFFVYRTSIKKVIIAADRVELGKVIINLLTNTLMYTYKNEPIFVDINQTKDQVEFIVTSRGILLSEKECMTMFDSFGARTPKYSTIGNGIALYLCKKIIDAHKGRIFASTDGEKFNKYTFILPGLTVEQSDKLCNLVAV